MKKIFYIITLFLIPFFCFSQVKQYVCAVHEIFYDQAIEDMKEYASNFRKSGLTGFADSMEEYIDGGSFGSGFVYVDKNGKNYIITNRHVVEQAKTLKVDFLNEDNSLISYEGLTIVSVGQDLDLAILAFPENQQPFTNGLNLYTGNLEDGNTVYTAGFPAYDGKPSWQLGTGNVTNAKMTGTKLVNPEITYLIQHSAQVDAGNSGGPLLRKGKDNTYYVVGINTWKALNRQATNFSIPAKAVQNFIEESLSPEKKTNEIEEITARAKTFQKLISNPKATYEEIIPFISMEYVSREGKYTLDYVLKHADETNKKTITSAFFNESPLEGMRYAIAWYIYNEYHKGEYPNSYNIKKESENTDENLTFEGPEKIPDSHKWKVTYNLNTKKGQAEAVWVDMYGVWQLDSFANAKTKKKAQKKRTAIAEEEKSRLGSLELYLPYKVSFAFRKGSQISKSPFISPFYFDIDVKINNFITAETSFEGDITPVKIVSGKNDYNPMTFMGGLLGIKGQLPVLVSNNAIIPFISVKGGAKYSVNPTNEKANIFATLEADAGAKVLLGIDSTIMPYLEGGYLYNYNFIPEKNRKTVFEDSFSCVYFGLGFAF